jgi:hypothetical protein
MRKMTAILGLFVGGLGLAGLAVGQQGGGFGGGFGPMGGGGRIDPVQLLNNASVKKELEITEDQTAAIPDAVIKALSGVLSDKQFKRFKQIELQQRGSAALSDAKIQEALKLTAEQKENIKTIAEDSRKEMREAFGGGGGGGGKGGFEKIENMRKEAMEKLTGVLTADQKTAWREMVGEPFKMERPTFGGGAGGAGFGKGNFKKKAASE